MGMRHLKIIPRSTSVASDIEICRQAIKHLVVDISEGTGNDYFVDMMHNYSKEWDSIKGVWKERPLHDEWSNPADAFRYVIFGRYAAKIGRPLRREKVRAKRRRSGGTAL